jgi:hypothetical protein
VFEGLNHPYKANVVKVGGRLRRRPTIGELPEVKEALAKAKKVP